MDEVQLLVRISRVELQTEVLMPRSVSLETSLDGKTALNADVKSRSSILT